jgi:hypothetical protein
VKRHASLVGGIVALGLLVWAAVLVFQKSQKRNEPHPVPHYGTYSSDKK